MRINRLDLLRYGRFTNVSLPFPKANSDLHVIFGPNEAGKSTSLAAIEDLLFGIPHNSPYNFIHDYGTMRMGGTLEHEGKLLDVRRRKGNRDTLLAPDDNPLPAGDSALAPFLGGATLYAGPAFPCLSMIAADLPKCPTVYAGLLNRPLLPRPMADCSHVVSSLPERARFTVSCWDPPKLL